MPFVLPAALMMLCPSAGALRCSPGREVAPAPVCIQPSRDAYAAAALGGLWASLTFRSQAGANRAELTAMLAQHGVAFFPNAFSKSECELLIQQFVDNCDVNEVCELL
jgi:hypothetical protein